MEQTVELLLWDSNAGVGHFEPDHRHLYNDQRTHAKVSPHLPPIEIAACVQSEKNAAREPARVCRDRATSNRGSFGG